MVFNITADDIHVYNLTIRCKALTHDAKHAINGEVECNILSKSFAKTCSLNCVQNFDHPIKKRVEYSLFFLSPPPPQKKPSYVYIYNRKWNVGEYFRKYKCIYPNEVGMNLLISLLSTLPFSSSVVFLEMLFHLFKSYMFLFMQHYFHQWFFMKCHCCCSHHV
jgi:hypothetical protein